MHDRIGKNAQTAKKSLECFLKVFGLFYSLHTVTNRQLSESVVGLDERVDFKDTSSVTREAGFSKRKSAVSTLVNTCLKLLFSRGPAQVKYILRRAGSSNPDEVS